ncbi:MAG TPA: aminomethyltransferase beta-barrel domain-containing protein, partial [Alphaproteobacteria bacterium]
APARVRALGSGRAEVVFESPQKAIAPGQAAVVYQGSRLMGGGWIERPAAPAA